MANVNNKLNKRKCQSGMDSLEFALVLEGLEDISFDETSLSNKANQPKSVVTIKCIGGRISGSVNAVHCIRNTNEKPFTLTDGIKMELVRCQVFEYIKECLQKNLQGRYSEKYIDDLKVTSLEVNITLPCAGKATQSDMVHLFDMVFDKTNVYRERKPGSKCEKVNTGVIYDKKHQYQLKVYDKTKDLHRQGILTAEKKLFRLEVVFKDRKLDAMFGKDKRTLDNVLSKKALDIMCMAYKGVLDEIVEQHIRPYLDNCVETLFESLTYSDKSNEIADTVMRYKEIIVDTQCLRKALHKWYEWRQKYEDPTIIDRTDEMIYKYRKKDLGLPDDVLKTLKAFHLAAG